MVSESDKFVFNNGETLFVVPKYMRPGLVAYVRERQRPGGFLRAVLENDLKMAVQTADAENLANLPAYVHYLYWCAPQSCWGSRQNVREWLSGGRKEGE